MEAENLKIELIEQPVKAGDFEAMKFVRDNVQTPVMADESLFSAEDCLRLLKMQACDLINIKLMKAGGIYNALKINAIAEAYGIETMLGSMLEGRVSVTAAAHLAAAKKNITRLDLDAPLYLAEEPVKGGIEINGPQISFSKGSGLAIRAVENLVEI
jgi:L-alanine-DL-glutamate epimerase-like enolase superfamily enzyme